MEARNLKLAKDLEGSLSSPEVFHFRPLLQQGQQRLGGLPQFQQLLDTLALFAYGKFTDYLGSLKRIIRML
jgi:hypothetical protein